MVNYHLIRPDECREVVALHRAAFPAEQVQRTIFGAARVGYYLTQLIRFPSWQNTDELWGAWHDTQLIGYAHFRDVNDSWHLNYIVVAPEHQGERIGTGLLGLWQESGQRKGFRIYSLDVEYDNTRALEWYQRRGLIVVTNTWTYEKRIVASVQGRMTVDLLGWPQAEAMQKTYGFSEFVLISDSKNYAIGRLGDDYFRTRQLLPPNVEGVLAEIDPSRRLLIRATQPLNDVRLQAVGRSLRMNLQVKIR